MRKRKVSPRRTEREANDTVARHKTPLEEKYKDVPHYELIQKDGVVNIPSIFMFTGGMTEYYSFLKACGAFNCTVNLQNEGISIAPNDDDPARLIKEMIYFQMLTSPEMVEQYLRFMLNRDKMTWESVTGQRDR